MDGDPRLISSVSTRPPRADGRPSFSLVAKPDGRPRLGLIQAALSFAGAVAAALSPFALVGAVAALSAHYGFNPDAQSGWVRLALLAAIVCVGLAVSLSAYKIARTLFERSLRRRQQPLADWSDLDGRFALLLRPFRDDRRRLMFWSVRPQLPFDLTAPWERLELQIVRAFRPLMPVLAVGRPSEPMPQLGARRFYVRSEDWREAVLYALDRCAIVIIVIGPGEGLRWEIGQALRRTAPEGTLFLFPVLQPGAASLLQRLGLGRRQSALEEQEQRYEAFAQQLRAAGVADFPARLDGAQVVACATDSEPTPIGKQRPRGALFKPLVGMTLAAFGALVAGAVLGLEATPMIFVGLLWFGAILAMRRSRTGSFDEALGLAVRRLQPENASRGLVERNSTR